MNIKVGHTEVCWYEGGNDNDPGVKYEGFVCGHNLDGLQVHTPDGQILTVKLSEVEEVPNAHARHQLHRDVHSDLSKLANSSPLDHEVEAEVSRRRASMVPQVPLPPKTLPAAVSEL